jgi:hypothetical protein
MRTFDTGATRDDDTHKVDYDGFVSIPALRAFGHYMRTHQVQADGTLRDSGNWKKGIPLDAYRKSMWRHFLDVAETLGVDGRQPDAIEALCALLFNVQGALHELVKEEREVAQPEPRAAKWYDRNTTCLQQCGMHTCTNPIGHTGWHEADGGFSW